MTDGSNTTERSRQRFRRQLEKQQRNEDVDVTRNLWCAAFSSPSPVFETTDETTTFSGTGALVSPLSATHFATTPHWSFQYVVSAGIAVSNIAVLSSVFRLHTLEGAFSYSLLDEFEFVVC